MSLNFDGPWRLEEAFEARSSLVDRASVGQIAAISPARSDEAPAAADSNGRRIALELEDPPAVQQLLKKKHATKRAVSLWDFDPKRLYERRIAEEPATAEKKKRKRSEKSSKPSKPKRKYARRKQVDEVFPPGPLWTPNDAAPYVDCVASAADADAFLNEHVSSSENSDQDDDELRVDTFEGNASALRLTRIHVPGYFADGGDLAETMSRHVRNRNMSEVVSVGNSASIANVLKAREGASRPRLKSDHETSAFRNGGAVLKFSLNPEDPFEAPLESGPQETSDLVVAVDSSGNGRVVGHCGRSYGPFVRLADLSANTPSRLKGVSPEDVELQAQLATIVKVDSALDERLSLPLFETPEELATNDAYYERVQRRGYVLANKRRAFASVPCCGFVNNSHASGVFFPQILALGAAVNITDRVVEHEERVLPIADPFQVFEDDSTTSEED